MFNCLSFYLIISHQLFLLKCAIKYLLLRVLHAYCKLFIYYAHNCIAAVLFVVSSMLGKFVYIFIKFLFFIVLKNILKIYYLNNYRSANIPHVNSPIKNLVNEIIY